MTASPAAMVWIVATRPSGWVSLSRKPLAPARGPGVDVVVEVEGGQDQILTATRRQDVAVFDAVPIGIRTS
jgi:hypothetical protein